VGHADPFPNVATGLSFWGHQKRSRGRILDWQPLSEPVILARRWT